MMTVSTPARLMTLIQIYTGTPVPVSPATNDAIKDFQTYGLVELVASGEWATTVKGKYLVDHLLKTPLPIANTVFSIERND